MIWAWMIETYLLGVGIFMAIAALCLVAGLIALIVWAVRHFRSD